MSFPLTADRSLYNFLIKLCLQRGVARLIFLPTKIERGISPSLSLSLKLWSCERSGARRVSARVTGIAGLQVLPGARHLAPQLLWSAGREPPFRCVGSLLCHHHRYAHRSVHITTNNGILLLSMPHFEEFFDPPLFQLFLTFYFR